MKIKICKENKQKIQKALDEINGKSCQHCFTDYEEIIELAKKAETKVFQLVRKKCDMSGAEIEITSGNSVANAYKYSRIATTIRILRTKTGWFLINVIKDKIFGDGGEFRIYLTEEQATRAINNLLENFSVIGKTYSTTFKKEDLFNSDKKDT